MFTILVFIIKTYSEQSRISEIFNQVNLAIQQQIYYKNQNSKVLRYYIG